MSYVLVHLLIPQAHPTRSPRPYCCPPGQTENRHREVKGCAPDLKSDRTRTEPRPSALNPRSVFSPLLSSLVEEAPVVGGGQGTKDPQRLSSDLKKYVTAPVFPS